MKTKLLASFDEHLDKYRGMRGTKKREGFERGSQAFYKQAMIDIEKEEKIKTKKRRLSGSNIQRPASRP
jgi:hypothetical protein